MENASVVEESIGNDETSKLDGGQVETEKKSSASIAPSDIDNIDDISPEELQNLFDRNTDSFRCLGQVLISRSSVLSHPLYLFDPPVDPGIDAAFSHDSNVDAPLDTVGIQTYKNRCKEFEIVPISRVIKSLTTNTLDLKYYGLSLKQIKALTAALVFNIYVENLILEENVLEVDAIYHLSEMLRDNNKISYLNLRNCWITPEAVKNLSEGIFTTQVVRELDLSNNNIKSSGVGFIAPSIRNNMSIKKLNLSRNGIAGDVGKKLGQALAENDCLEELDLSWNNINALNGLQYLCEGLIENNKLKVLNLAWNGISTKEAFLPVMRFMKASTALEHIDLSNNQMQGVLLKMVRAGILASSSLIGVNMSSNIITPEEASTLAHVFTADRGEIEEPFKLKYLNMENVYVNKNFVPYWRKLTRQEKFVQIEGILSNYKIAGPDVKKLLFDRVRYLSQKPKKKKKRKEFGHFLYSIDKTMQAPGKKLGKDAAAAPPPPDPAEGMVKADFFTALKKFKMGKVHKDEDLLKEIIKKYAISKDKINTTLMRKDYYDYYPQTSIPEAKKKKKKGGKKQRKGKNKVPDNLDDTQKAAATGVKIEDKNPVDEKGSSLRVRTMSVQQSEPARKYSEAASVRKEKGVSLALIPASGKRQSAVAGQVVESISRTSRASAPGSLTNSRSKSILKKRDSKGVLIDAA